MNAKEYLSQAFRLVQRINSKLEQVNSLRDLATKATASIHAERVSGTKQKSPMENAIVRVIDLEHEINDDIGRLVDLKCELTTLISDIEKPAHRMLLELRYLGRKTWDEICGELGYERSWVFRLHGKALKEIEKIMTTQSQKFENM